MPTLAEEAYEAVCGALHYNKFNHVGERTTPAGRESWWQVGNGDMLRDVRVTVSLDREIVHVTPEWRITAAPPRIVTTKLPLRINTDAEGSSRQKLQEATQSAVYRCLEVYRDVLEQKGYASAQYLADNERRKMAGA